MIDAPRSDLDRLRHFEDASQPTRDKFSIYRRNLCFEAAVAAGEMSNAASNLLQFTQTLDEYRKVFEGTANAKVESRTGFVSLYKRHPVYIGSY